MPYISNARLEHIRLSAKIEVLDLLIERSHLENTGFNTMVETQILNLRGNLDHMRSVMERNARL